MNPRAGIEVGDLVMVVRGHQCTLSRIGGVPFLVDKIDAKKTWFCSRCGLRDICADDTEVLLDKDADSWWSVPLSWLKKFPPLQEPESERAAMGEKV